jgi:hypothetical protein
VPTVVIRAMYDSYKFVMHDIGRLRYGTVVIKESLTTLFKKIRWLHQEQEIQLKQNKEKQFTLIVIIKTKKEEEYI